MELRPTFPPGSRVQIRDEEWLVRKAVATGYGDVELHVTGLSELVRDKEMIFLHPGLDEVKVLDPRDTDLVADDSPRHIRTRLYLESLLRRTPPTDERIHLGHEAAIGFSEYQLVPGAQALARPQPRILIADAVGLGKTVEVGILLSELIRRGRGRRILVVALNSILEQFQTELWARFTIPLVRLDSVGLARVAREIPTSANLFHHFDKVIISIDTLKNDGKYRRHLEQAHWDAIVIDECQHVALRGSGASDRAKLAQLLARTCDSLIFTSATPHDGKAESFASLIELLDPTALPHRGEVKADQIRDLYVRRFKKDLVHGQDAFKERVLRRHEVPASAPENELYEALREIEFETIRPRAHRAGGKGVLFRTLLKSLLSSPAALGQTLESRLRQLEKSSQSAREIAKTGRKPSTLAPDEGAVARDVEKLRRLFDLTQAIEQRAGSKWPKLEALLTEMGVVPGGSERVVVVFATRIETLTQLRERLREKGFSEDELALFHGGLGDDEQQEITKRFGTRDASLRVLLTSDAAAEGLNLHHECHRLVHFDIPWSLITLEQRNGRIDRFGQKHRPGIHYLLSRPANEAFRGDLRVIDVLIEKERMAHDALGDVQWLLQCFDPEAEEEVVGEVIDSGKRAVDELLALLDAASEGERDHDTLSPAQHGARATIHGFEKITPETGKRLQLFSSDLDYAEAAFGMLSPSLALSVERKPDLRGFILEAPEDLRRRLAYLPPELRAHHLRLTQDREFVQRQYQEAREKGRELRDRLAAEGCITFARHARGHALPRRDPGQEALSRGHRRRNAGPLTRPAPLPPGAREPRAQRPLPRRGRAPAHLPAPGEARRGGHRRARRTLASPPAQLPHHAGDPAVRHRPLPRRPRG